LIPLLSFVLPVPKL